MKKLIVDRDDAKLIRDAVAAFDLIKALDDNDSTSSEFKLRTRYPIGARFWVAEPVCRICKNGGVREWFFCDPAPDGWRRYTLARPGSRVNHGEHRFEVEVVAHKLIDPSPTRFFKKILAKITFKHVRPEL